MTLNFQRNLIAALVVSANLSACAPPKGHVTSQDLVAASTRISASNSHWLLIGTQSQGAYALTETPLTPRYHWQNDKDFPTPITAIAIASRAPKAITASNDRLVIWNSNSGQAEHYLSAPSVINSLAINSEGTLAALALANNTAVIINLVRGGVVNTLVHQSSVLSIAIDGQHLLTGEEANRAHLWQINQNSPIRSFDHNDGVNYVAFGPNNLLVTAGRYDATKFWDKNSDKIKSTISSSAKAMDAGRRAIGVIFENTDQVVIGYSDSTIERVNLPNAKTIKKWVVSASTPFTKNGATLVGIEQVEGKIYAITSDSRAHRLLD